MTEKEKMLAGEVYDATSRELIAELQAAREVLHEFNMLRPSETQRMKEILKGLLGHVADDEFIINQPFHCDYGSQISIGKRFFAGTVAIRFIGTHGEYDKIKDIKNI